MEIRFKSQTLQKLSLTRIKERNPINSVAGGGGGFFFFSRQVKEGKRKGKIRKKRIVVSLNGL